MERFWVRVILKTYLVGLLRAISSSAKSLDSDNVKLKPFIVIKTGVF